MEEIQRSASINLMSHTTRARRCPRIFRLGAMPKRSAGMFPSLEHACAALRHGTRTTGRRGALATLARNRAVSKRITMCLLVLLTAVEPAAAQIHRPSRPTRARRQIRPAMRRPGPPTHGRIDTARHATTSALSWRSAMGINRTGRTREDLAAFVARPQLMLRSSSYTAPIRRLSIGGSLATFRYAPSQDDIERTLREIDNTDITRDDYSLNLLLEIRGQRKRLIEDGWAFLKDGDYLRSRGAFEAAETVDPHAPAPRFGQLIVDVANRHYRRAMTQLAKNLSYDQRRRPGTDAIFEYNISLQRAFPSDETLRIILLELRRFAQFNVDAPAVQALYCYVLWYSRFDDAMIEAVSIARRLRRTAGDPESAWAMLHSRIQEAMRKLQLERRAGTAPGPTPPAMPPT